MDKESKTEIEIYFTPLEDFYNTYCKSSNKEYAKHNPCPKASLVSFNKISNFSIDI